MEHGQRSLLQQIPRKTRRLILAAIVIALVAVGIPAAGHLTDAKADPNSPACIAARARLADHDARAIQHNAEPHSFSNSAQLAQYDAEAARGNAELIEIRAAIKKECAETPRESTTETTAKPTPKQPGADPSKNPAAGTKPTDGAPAKQQKPSTGTSPGSAAQVKALAEQVPSMEIGKDVAPNLLPSKGAPLGAVSPREFV